MSSNNPLNNYSKDFILSAGDAQLKGFVSKSGVANFLNIPFGRVPVRLRPSEAVNLSDIHGLYDATRYGSIAPQHKPPPYVLGSISHMWEQITTSQPLDESACLNLNIYAPPEALTDDSQAKLPVFVWVHGGAYMGGENGTMYDGNHLVKRSMDINKPIVVVVIAYRCNIFGFCTSQELIDEAKELGETPILNPGLYDQRLAFKWVQNNIHHFGGDASRVTAAGESAGASSLLCHLRAGIPLFKQVILESPPAMILRTMKTAQIHFDGLLEKAGISLELNSPAKLAALRALTTEQYLDLFKFKGAIEVPAPVDDPNWFEDFDLQTIRTPSYWARLPKWCDRTVIGSCKDEAVNFLPRGGNITREDAINLVECELGHPNALFPYADDYNCSQKEMIEWASNHTFTYNARTIGSEAAVDHKAHTFLYSIASVDPFPGPLQGYAWHSFGLPFTFNQPTLRKDPELAAMQDNITAALLGFCHGEEPWEEFGKGRRLIQWRGSSVEMVPAVVEA